MFLLFAKMSWISTKWLSFNPTSEPVKINRFLKNFGRSLRDLSSSMMIKSSWISLVLNQLSISSYQLSKFAFSTKDFNWFIFNPLRWMMSFHSLWENLDSWDIVSIIVASAFWDNSFCKRRIF
jgi:hypothetical protein